MSGATDILIKKLADTINSSPAKKVSPYDTQAEVKRVEGDIAWVHIPGGVDETPVQLTTNAKKGDIVQVRVSGGRAWLYGNKSSPPTDDTKANKVEKDLLKTEVEVYETITITETKIYNQIEAARAHIDELIAEKADITDLNAATARIGTLETTKADITDLNAATARIGTLETDNASIKGRLTTAEADIDTLDANKATITDLNAATARIGTLESDHVSVSDFQAEQANIDTLQANTADIDTIRANSAKVQNLTAAQLEADHATVGSLNANYAQINLANVNNSWITNGVIKNAAIGDAQISGVSANKLTAGTIDASNITVTNLNADNITTGTINGQRIGAGSLSLDKLSEDVYTETEVDNKLRDIQLEIDGAIETYTGTVVPTLNNTPASSWTTTDLKNKHVGDIYYVVNNSSQQNGYCYRFTKSGNVYSWTLIKDSDVTAALQRLTEAEGDISGLQQFETTTSSWISNTDTELNSLKSRTTNVETSLGDKVSTSTFNELSQTVDENTASITSLGETVETKADSSTVTTLSNTVNTVQQTANGNSSKISSLTTTLGTNADGTTKAGDVVHRTSAVEQDLSGFKTTVSNTYATKTALNDKADADDLDALTTRVSTAETTITQQAGQIGLKANSSDVYTKTATNNLLADKADADDVYTKDDIDDEFALYTKTADFSVAPGQIQSTITNAVAGKANSSDVYTKTQIDQTVNSINTTVSSKVGNDEVISRINQSSESITIDANRVNIAGAAIFDNYSLKSQTVSNVVVEYAKSNGATTQPTSGWSTNTPTWEAGKYIWQRTGKTINGTTTYTYTCIQGATGATGQTGPQGVSVTNVTSTNNTADGGTSVITVTLSNGTTKTFNVKNGNKGTNGASSQWYYGTACTHTSGTATPATGISSAIVGDMYLNNNTYSVYRCTTAGASGVAVWTYAGNLVDGVIDDIEVGGTNLLSRIVKFYSSSSYNAYRWNLTENLIAGQTYTIQLWDVDVAHSGKTESTLGIYVYWGGGNIELFNWSGTSYFTNGHADYLTKTFTITSSQASGATAVNKWLNIYNSPPQVSGTMSMSIGKWKLEKGNIATEWSPAPEDALGSSQRIYKRTNSATAPAAPTSIVTATTDQGVTGNWTLMHMPRVAASNTSYKYLWTCEQQISLGGYFLGTTAVVADNGTTVIDGGDIITGTVTAAAINASSGTFDTANIPILTASKIDATNLHVSSANIDGNLTIGKITNLQTTLDGKADDGDIPTKVSDLTNDSNFATESYADGKASAAQTAAISTASTDATNKANAAAWTVSIEVSSINYSTPTAILVAKPYYYGTLTTSGITYQWSKNGTNISGATNNSYTATDFNASYTCTIS